MRSTSRLAAHDPTDFHPPQDVGRLESDGMEPHPWLKPLSRRVGVVVACLAWLGFETYYDIGGLWFWLALGATAYAIWDFFLSGNYREAAK
jgi:hypothetical protein